MAAHKTHSLTWIVLVRKTPLGPFTETEVKDQLAKGFIRINDLAYQIPEGAKAVEPTEWLFLWQYPQFDRRRTENQNDPANRPTVERRSPVNRERMERSKTSQLSNVASLTQKDLVAQARNAWAQEKNAVPSIVPTPEAASRNRRLGYLYWSMAIILGITVLPTILKRSGLFMEKANAVTVRPQHKEAHITTFPDSRK